jgi:O-antigen ligase
LSRSRHLRVLDALLVAILLYGVLQVAPLPMPVVKILSPHAPAVHASLRLMPAAGATSLSIAPAASGHALLVLFATLLTFWSARATFRAGGIRTTARGVALWGLLASLVGLLQHASSTRLVYWWWAPVSEGPAGFGPFINRNHFAAWVVMALALSMGYLAARTHAPDGGDRFRSFTSRMRRRMDGRAMWLLAAIGLMTIGLVLTLSRSGLAGAAVAAVVAHLLSARRLTRYRRRLWVAAGVVLAMAILWTGPAALVGRWQHAEIGQEGRSVIWRETAPLVRDFWLTGTGVGTYGDAMTLYQRTDRRVHFNQAHNHYLQVAAEGGLLLIGLVAAALIALLLGLRERMAADQSNMLWLRVGAAAGLVGLAVQSGWETGARMPANALLAAVLAAVALHEAHHHRPARSPEHPV